MQDPTDKSSTPTEPHLILLHGLGDESPWNHYAITYGFPTSYDAPKAPEQVVTANRKTYIKHGFDPDETPEQVSWGDIDVFPIGPDTGSPDEAGWKESLERVTGLIDEKVDAGLDPSKIAIFGFSQGAALALGVARAYKHKLGQVVACSGWVVKALQDLPAGPGAETPVTIFHGTRDVLVLPTCANDVQEKLFPHAIIKTHTGGHTLPSSSLISAVFASVIL